MGVTQALNPGNETNTLQTFSDATAGRSLILYYAAIMTTSGGVTYGLTRDGGYSDPTTIGVVSPASADFSFDVTINKATMFQGLGYVDLHAIATGNLPPNTQSVTVTAYHYDGAVATSLGTSTSKNLPGGAGAIDYYIKLPLSLTRKAFKPGDILRLKVSLSCNGANLSVSVDPSVSGGELKFWAPVVVLE